MLWPSELLVDGVSMPLEGVLSDVSIRHGRDDVTADPTASTMQLTLLGLTHDQVMAFKINAALVLNCRDGTGPSVARFTGRVTDATLDDDALTLIAVGPIATLGRYKIGTVSWPEETWSARVKRIFNEAGLTPAAIALTASGNEITDATRTAAVQGDGRPVEGSFGIWRPTTNLIANGGLETNTSGFFAQGTATLSRVTTEKKFGAASLKTVLSAAGTAGAANSYDKGSALGAGSVYSLSCWVKGEGATIGKTFTLQLQEKGAALSQGSVVLSASWQRVTVTRTVVSTTSTGFWIYANVAGATNDTFYVDGLQLELAPIATPYVETNGATATKAAARVQMPVATSGFTATQGWVALRVRPGWAGGSPDSRRFWSWRDAANNGIELLYTAAGAFLWGSSINNNTATFVQIPYGASFSANVPHTLVFAWTGTQLRLSLDGAPFVAAARGAVPTIGAAADPFDIGRAAHTASQWVDGDVFWFAAGRGALSDGDAARLHSFGNTGPTSVGQLPGDARAYWAADTTSSQPLPYLLELQPDPAFDPVLVARDPVTAGPTTLGDYLAFLAPMVGAAVVDRPYGAVLVQATGSRTLATPTVLDPATVAYVPAWYQDLPHGNVVTVRYTGDQSQSVTVRDDSSVSAYGAEFATMIDTTFKNASDATTRANQRLTRSAYSHWNMPAAPLLVPRDLPIGVPVWVSLFPDASPYDPWTPILEGWTDTISGNTWTMELTLSDPLASGITPLAWNQTGTYKWNTINQTVAWKDALTPASIVP